MLAGFGDIWNLIVKISGDGSNFRDDIKEDIATLDELFASLHDTAVSINLDDVDAQAKLDEFKLKLDELRNATEKINLDDAVAKDELDQFKLKLDELRNQTVDINLEDTDAKEKIDELKAKLAEIKNPDVKVNLDNTNLEAQVEEAKIELDSLPNDKDVKVNVDNADLEVQVEEAKLELDQIPDEKVVHVRVEQSGGAGRATDSGGAGGGILPWLIASALPLISPIGAPALAGGMGLLSSLVSGGVGTAGLAAVGVGDLKPVFNANSQVNSAQQSAASATTPAARATALKQEQQAWASLDTSQQQALHSLQSFSSFWQGFVTQFSKPVTDMFTNGLKMLQSLLTDMKPVITASAQAFSQLEQGASKALESPFWKNFFNYLGGSAKQSIVDIGQSMGNMVKGVSALVMAFDPMAKSMNQGLVNLTQRFADWATQLSKTKGFQDFLNYARQEGPQVLQLIGNLATTVAKLLIAMAPAGALLLQVVNGVLKFVNALLGANPLVGQLATAVMEGVAAMKLLGPVINGVLTAVKWFGTAFLGAGEEAGAAIFGLSGPIGWIIGAVIAAAILIITHWKEVSSGAQQLWQDVKNYFDQLGSDISSIWSGIVQTVTNFWNSMISGIRSAWNAFVSWINDAVQSFVNGVADAFKWLYNHNYYFKDLVDSIQKLWKTAEQDAQQIWGAITKWLSEAWKSLIKTASDIIEPIIKWFSGVWTSISQDVSSAWSGIASALSSAATSAYHAITSVFDQLGSYFTGLWNEAYNWGANIVNHIADGIRSAVNAVRSAASSVASAIGSFLGFHSPTEEGPGSEADVWMPNLMNMLVSGIRQGTPMIQAALSQVMVPPNVSSMMQQAGQRFAQSAATGFSQAVHAPINVNINAPVYGVNDLHQAIRQGVQEHVLPTLVNQLKPTARAMGVSR